MFSLANVLILSSLLISWASATDLCYRINYNCDSNIDNCENSLLVQPLAKINAGHELLTGPQCAINYEENQLIPASGRWSQSGSASNSGSCYDVDGGELIYAYHHPKSYSSNTGFEENEKAQFLFVVDEGGDLYFVIGLDKPGNADGGRFAMQFESVNSDPADLQNTYISLYDDVRGNSYPGTAWNGLLNYGGDKYSWDSSNGRGSMRWQWATCCTDGAVLAGLESVDIEFTIKMIQPVSHQNHNAAPNGIDSFLFPSWNNNTNTFDSITEVFWSDVENGLRISVNDCNTYCGQYDGCSRCATDPRCTWCEAGVGSCQESTNLDSTCPNTDDRKDGCDCNVCEPLTDCTSCVQSDEVCVWTGTECKSERADGAACDGTVGTNGDCTCDSTQVANSVDHSATNSIFGDYGDSFNVTCRPGFSDNEATTTCNGFQFTNLPVCEAGACVSVNVANSNYASTPLSGYTDDSFVVTCSDGYEGGGTSTCQTNGQFSSVQCTKIQCTDVTIAHATPSPVQGEAFTSYDVTCDEGYHVNGQDDETLQTQSTTCQSTGQFTTLQTCVANECVSFSHANSNRASPVTGMTTGQAISVTCNTGYTNNGNVFVQTATCQTDGTFNTLNACAANTCGSAFVANSDHDSSNPIDSLTTDQTLDVECNAGYTIDGTERVQTATCQTNGDISSLSACNANTCSDQSITNAVGTPFTGFTTGEVVSVVCEVGYYGGGDMTCDGVTSSFNNVPSCNQILCTQPLILFGNFVEEWPTDVPDDTNLNDLNISCDNNYYRSDATLTCGCSANGERCDTLTNACVSNGCSPPTVLNGQYDPTDWVEHSNQDGLDRTKISCNSGYSRSSTQIFTCSCPVNREPCEDINNACDPNQCAAINVQSGALSADCPGGNAVDGLECIFECSDGYTISGSGTISCDMSGAWPAYPTCTENVCDAINITASRTTAGADCEEEGASGQPECIFSCVAGYALSDATAVSCDYDGNWGSYPTCVPQSCTSIEIANSDFSESNSVNGVTDEIRVVTCNDGYTENDPTRIQTLKCDGNTMTFRRLTSNGVLDNVMECVPNVCTPTFHENSNASEAGSIQGTTGDVVTVTCDVGYTNDGSTTTIQTTCDGQSFSSLAECVPNQCLETSVENSLTYSSIGSINGSTGDTIEVVCEDGYSPGGTAICGTDGTFNEVTCEPEACETAFVPYSNYAEYDSINGTTGDTFNIVCNNWFVLQGNAQVTCQADNTLSVLPTCQGASVCLVEKGEDYHFFTNQAENGDCTYESHDNDEQCLGEPILPLNSDKWVAVFLDGGIYNASWSMKDNNPLSSPPVLSNRGDKIASMEGVDYGIDITTCNDGAVCCDGSCFYDQDADRCNAEKTYEACCTVASTTDDTTSSPATSSESPATSSESPATTSESPATTSESPASTSESPASTSESPTIHTTSESDDAASTESGDVVTTQAPDTVTTETVTESPSVDEFRFEVEVNGLNQTFVEENLNEVGDAIGEAFCGKLISDLTENSSEEDAVSCVTMSITLSQNRRRALSVEGAAYLVDLKVTSTDSTVTDRISNDNGAVFADITSNEIEQSLQANGIEGAVQGDDLEVTSVELSSGPDESGSSSSSSNDNTILFAAAGAGVLVVVLLISCIVYRRMRRHQETMDIKSNLDTNFEMTTTAHFDSQNTSGMEKQDSVFIENQRSIHEL